MEGTVSRNDNTPKISSSSGPLGSGTGGSIGAKKSPLTAGVKKKKI